MIDREGQRCLSCGQSIVGGAKRLVDILRRIQPRGAAYAEEAQRAIEFLADKNEDLALRAECLDLASRSYAGPPTDTGEFNLIDRAETFLRLIKTSSGDRPRTATGL